jgi:mitogen-activated protein kinase kinase kinase 4
MRIAGRLARPRADRRNTVDCAILNQMIIEPGADAAVVKRSESKRNSQLIRLAERDSKMSSVVLNVMNNRNSGGVHHEQIDMENVVAARSAIAAPTTIESSSCFKSVESRRMGCRVSAPSSQFHFINFRESLPTDGAIDDDDPLKSRKDFFDTFANCIKLGSDRNTKSMISREDYIWQTEIKDMIWLELQAWHADRTLEQQDTFLYELRSDVEILLEDIMTYKFHRKPRPKQPPQSLNTSDSGFATASTLGEEKSGFCFGCLSMSCPDCLQSQSIALKNVEVLLTRLEAAESLYPSTKAMGQQYPLYRTAEFIGRVKAMCLWYNMTRHLRLKLLILGKMLTRLQGKKYSTAMFETESSSSPASSAHESEGYESSSRDSYDHSKAVNECKISCKPSVHFIPELEVESSGDSVNSTISEE